MNSSVDLQNPFSYALWPVITTGIIVLLILAFFLSLRLLKTRRKKPPVVVKKRFIDMEKIKEKYIKELDQIGREFENGNVDIREAYQRMSMCIRKFVNTVTGIKVQNYTLNEIKGLNMPELANLVSEYYVPEFAERSEGDVRASLTKTRSMIERWR